MYRIVEPDGGHLFVAHQVGAVGEAGVLCAVGNRRWLVERVVGDSLAITLCHVAVLIVGKDLGAAAGRVHLTQDVRSIAVVGVGVGVVAL